MDDNKVWVGEGQELEKCEKVVAFIDNERFEVDYDGKSSILETLINAGINAPYSCMAGSCMACLGKIRSGRAYMEDYHILTEDNVEEGECLTCSSFPASQTVEVTYDDL